MTEGDAQIPKRSYTLLHFFCKGTDRLKVLCLCFYWQALLQLREWRHMSETKDQCGIMKRATEEVSESQNYDHSQPQQSLNNIMWLFLKFVAMERLLEGFVLTVILYVIMCCVCDAEISHAWTRKLIPKINLEKVVHKWYANDQMMQVHRARDYLPCQPFCSSIHPDLVFSQGCPRWGEIFSTGIRIFVVYFLFFFYYTVMFTYV